MYDFEIIIFLFAAYYTVKSLFGWYQRLFGIWPPERNKTAKYVLGFLPVASFIIILYTLKKLASFDVVGDSVYIFFYILVGYTWVFLSLKLVFLFFDISWIDDAISLDNKAAIYTITGAFLGLVLIYSGANVGDGPGWWCVIFAGGLGLIAWIVLGVVLNKYTQVFERITVERDVYCGIRTGAYLLASGLILARASAGDWTSFSQTIVEFFVGWPVLLLTVIAIFVERYYLKKTELRRNTQDDLAGAVGFAVIYVVLAIISIMLFPLVENPAYGSAFLLF